jgi:hypothetical protein
MPNHCNNEIRITFASQEDASRFLNKAHADDSIARAFRPMPAILDGTQSPTPEDEFDPNGRFRAWVNDPTNEYWNEELYAQHKAAHAEKVRRSADALAETGFSNWYDWADANWGTKWGDYDLDLGMHNQVVSGHFTTAWGPLCEDFWKYVSTCYPTAQILVTYDEPGMGFEGAEAYFDGECVYSESQESHDLTSMAEYALEKAAD